MLSKKPTFRLFSTLLILIFTLAQASPVQAAPGDTVLISLTSSGAQGNEYVSTLVISADGRYVAFESYATNMVSGDTNWKWDIFLRDTLANTTTRLSVGAGGVEGNGDSSAPTISADGRYVAFYSAASNLVSGDTNGTYDVFVRDTIANTTTRISVDSSGVQGNGGSASIPSISADGRYVVFNSAASNLVSGDTNGVIDVFMRDRVANTTTLVSVDSSGAQGDGNSASPSISPDGRYVAFYSFASNLVNGDTNGVEDVFVRDMVTNTTTRVSVTSSGAQGNGGSGTAAISADGRYVVFNSVANNLVSGDTNAKSDVFVRDTVANTTTRVSVSSSGAQGDNASDNLSISSDGRYVAFESDASTLVSGDTNGARDIFVRDIVANTTTRVSVDSNGVQANHESFYPSISADGTFVAFGSFASNLVSGDTNFYSDVFVHENKVDPRILVQDEGGNPVSGAQVFRNGTLAGITGANGILFITDLAVGDQLAARQLVSEVSSQKNNHNQDASQNWAYRIYTTSLEVPQNGDPAPWIVAHPSNTQTLTLKKSNALIGFNIVAAVEWDANAAYLNELQQGFQSASNYLYDASDGQMLFERVTIYDNNQNMGDADYQVRTSNQEWPRANVSGILSGDNLHVFLGRYFDGSSANQGSWTASNGFRTQIHEFGHYGLGLYDSYFYYDAQGNKHDSHCTSAAIVTNQTPGINATLMDYQYNASEFSMQNVTGLWTSQCQDTAQWVKNGQSDWETIVGHYQDPNAPVRWEMKTPAIYGSVVAGPDTQPVSAWSSVTVGEDANTGVCDSLAPYRFEISDGTPTKGANVVLRKGDRTLDQGKTDLNGEITVLGASNGDHVVANLSLGENNLWQKSTQVNCGGAPSQSLTARAPTTTIILEPAAYALEVSTAPGAAANQVKVTVKASTSLASAPETGLTQNGAVAVPVALSYDAVSQAYTGTITLDADLPASGNILTIATDIAGQVVEVATQFAIQWVSVGQDATVTSSDGQAELYLPAGSVSADGRVNIVAAQVTGALPDKMVLLSGPYTFQGDENLTLVNNANLSLYYLEADWILNQVAASTAQIYHWDGSNWQALSSTASQVEQVVSAVINEFGTYALMVEDTVHPTVTSIVRAGTNPTSAASVNFTVTFSEPVIGVDASDFSPTTIGITGASVTGVSGSGSVYTVTANTGSGDGTLGLGVLGDIAILDGVGNPLNGGYSSGESYTVTTYTLTLNSDHGAVAKNPDQPTYHMGDVVQFTATPNAGWSFLTWSGGLTGTANPDSVTIQGATTVTANYTQNEYTLTITSAHGTVAKNPDQATYHEGDVVQLTATPTTGWAFANWTGGLTGSANPGSITIHSNTAVTANYTQNEYSLTLTSDHGTVTKIPNQTTYHEGDVVQLTAVSATSWLFSSWSGALTGSVNPASVTIHGNTAVTANYLALSLLTVKSTGTQDGWILESAEKSNKGGTLDIKTTTFRLGDDNLKKQYLGILSFSTGGGLPDNAVITKVTLKVKKQVVIGGGDPVTTFQGFMVEIKNGILGTAALQAGDFQAKASKTYDPFKPALIGGWYSLDLTVGKSYLNKLSIASGLTQVRLRFKLDDNNNAVANHLSLYSGNAPAASRPQLIIEYYVP